MIFWDDRGMAKRYRLVERDQPFLLPPDMREWLPPGHPVHLVIRVVEEHLDTSAFHARRRAGGAGAAGYDPDMLVTVLVWGYAHQVTSSRRIEQLCRTDVAFRLICGGNMPDHATIARFRAGFPDVITSLFAEVLALCARLGMGKLGVVALDGTKIAASAGKPANRTEEHLRKLAAETVAAHAAADAAEDDLFGPGRRGDEVPEDAWSPQDRDSRIAAALARIRAEREAAEQAEAARGAAARARREHQGRRPGSPPVSAAVAVAQEKLDRVRAARAARLAALEERYAAGEVQRRPRQAGVEDYARRAADRDRGRKGPGRVANLTDPDSRLMPVRGGGFIQGYNAQNVVSSDGLIIATTLTAATTDMRWFEPMLAAAAQAAAHIAAHRAAGSGDDSDGIGLILADAGYCSEHNLTVAGPDRLIAVGNRRNTEKAAAGRGNPGREPAGAATRAMAERLKTSDGITAYRQRGHIAETPHGHLKQNMRLRQLSVRGHARASAEWQFAVAVHNIFKAITTGHLTPAALDTLPA
jgi:transposase